MQTIPIVLGTRWTKIIISILIGLTLFLVLWVLFKKILFLAEDTPDFLSLIYTFVLVIIPLLLLFVLVLRARDKKAYSIASLLIKLIMLFGILYSAVFTMVIKSSF